MDLDIPSTRSKISSQRWMRIQARIRIGERWKSNNARIRIISK